MNEPEAEWNVAEWHGEHPVDLNGETIGKPRRLRAC